MIQLSPVEIVGNPKICDFTFTIIKKSSLLCNPYKLMAHKNFNNENVIINYREK